MGPAQTQLTPPTLCVSMLPGTRLLLPTEACMSTSLCPTWPSSQRWAQKSAAVRTPPRGKVDESRKGKVHAPYLNKLILSI